MSKKVYRTNAAVVRAAKKSTGAMYARAFIVYKQANGYGWVFMGESIPAGAEALQGYVMCKKRWSAVPLLKTK
jgi:hypothetical protein